MGRAASVVLRLRGLSMDSRDHAQRPRRRRPRGPPRVGATPSAAWEGRRLRVGGRLYELPRRPASDLLRLRNFLRDGSSRSSHPWRNSPHLRRSSLRRGREGSASARSRAALRGTRCTSPATRSSRRSECSHERLAGLPGRAGLVVVRFAGVAKAARREGRAVARRPGVGRAASVVLRLRGLSMDSRDHAQRPRRRRPRGPPRVGATPSAAWEGRRLRVGGRLYELPRRPASDLLRLRNFLRDGSSRSSHPWRNSPHLRRSSLRRGREGRVEKETP